MILEPAQDSDQFCDITLEEIFADPSSSGSFCLAKERGNNSQRKFLIRFIFAWNVL